MCFDQELPPNLHSDRYVRKRKGKGDMIPYRSKDILVVKRKTLCAWNTVSYMDYGLEGEGLTTGIDLQWRRKTLCSATNLDPFGPVDLFSDPLPGSHNGFCQSSQSSAAGKRVLTRSHKHMKNFWDIQLSWLRVQRPGSPARETRLYMSST